MRDQKPSHSVLLGVAAGAAVAVLLLGLTAGSMNVDKKGDGDKAKNVDIQTPFGGLQVRTEVDPKEIGLPVYAGARQVPDDRHDSGSANVTLGVPGFGMKVIAAKFESDDSSDKVLEFYRKELKSFGSVTECKGDLDLKGDPGSQEVTCKDDPVHKDKVELAAGKGSTHRIVSVEPTAGGCKFALVYLQFRGKEGTM